MYLDLYISPRRTGKTTLFENTLQKSGVFGVIVHSNNLSKKYDNICKYNIQHFRGFNIDTLIIDDVNDIVSKTSLIEQFNLMYYNKTILISDSMNVDLTLKSIFGREYNILKILEISDNNISYSKLLELRSNISINIIKNKNKSYIGDFDLDNFIFTNYKKYKIKNA